MHGRSIHRSVSAAHPDAVPFQQNGLPAPGGPDGILCVPSLPGFWIKETRHRRQAFLTVDQKEALADAHRSRVLPWFLRQPSVLQELILLLFSQDPAVWSGTAADHLQPVPLTIGFYRLDFGKDAPNRVPYLIDPANRLQYTHHEQAAGQPSDDCFAATSCNHVQKTGGWIQIKKTSTLRTVPPGSDESVHFDQSRPEDLASQDEA